MDVHVYSIYILIDFEEKKLAMPDISSDREYVLNDIEDIPVRWRSVLFRWYLVSESGEMYIYH